MSENESPRNGVVGFLTSLPGILASIGALITAVGGIYLGVHSSGPGPQPSSEPAAASVVINLQTRPPGDAPDPARLATVRYA
jgi:hypothetical protein